MSKVDAASAEEEFNRFAELMDLEIDQKLMTDEDKVNFVDLKSGFIRGVMRGRVTVNDDGEPSVIFEKPPSDDENEQGVTFYEPDGACFLALDKGKKNADNAKQYMMMGEICKCSHSLFAKLKNRDLKYCKVILTLFLA